MRVAVFLRAVNVGGRKLLAADFKAALAEAGCGAIQTVGAAGSAVVEAAAADARLESAAEDAIRARAGYVSEVFARGGTDLARALAANPFQRFAAEAPNRLVAVFLRRDPEPAQVAAVAQKIVGGEEVAGGPRCLYAWYPEGQGTSKLTLAVIEKALADRGTARNWNTVRRMAELTSGV
jgi:uncharacterized protein (DUF1697 family)